MTIPYIPAIDPSVVNSIDSLGQTVDQIAHPQKQFQEALKATLAAHPELVQQMGNLAARSPESVQRLYGPQVADYFKSIGQSDEDRANQATAKVNATVATDTGAALAAMPAPVRQAQAASAAERMIGGGHSINENRVDAQNTTALKAADEFIAHNQGMAPTAIVDAIRNRTSGMNATIATGLMNGASGPLYTRLMQEAEQRDLTNLQNRLANARDEKGVQASEDQSIRIITRQLMAQNPTSNFDSWFKVVKDGANSPEILAARAKSPEDRSPEDQNLIDAADGLIGLNEQARVRALTPVFKLLQGQLTSLSAVLGSHTLSNEAKSNTASAMIGALNRTYANARLPVQAHLTPFKDNLIIDDKATVTYTVTTPDGKTIPASAEQVDQMVQRAAGTAPAQQASATSAAMTDEQRLNGAADDIIKGTATLEQLQATTNFTNTEKAYIRGRVASGRTN